MFSNRQNARHLHTIKRAHGDLKNVFERYDNVWASQLTENEQDARRNVRTAAYYLYQAIEALERQTRPEKEWETDPFMGNDAGEAL